MKTNFVLDPHFKDVYKKRIGSNPILKKQFQEKIHLFSENPNHDSLETHDLHILLKDLSSFACNQYYRVVFKRIDAGTVIFIDLGNYHEIDEFEGLDAAGQLEAMNLKRRREEIFEHSLEIERALKAGKAERHDVVSLFNDLDN